MKAIVFLGAGRITSALVAGLCLASDDRPIVAYDRHPEKLRHLRKHYNVKAETNLQRAIEQAAMLVIAVRPASVASLLREIGVMIRSINRPVIAVSLAAGIPLATLRAHMAAPFRWARAMPSPVCRSGKGLTALAFDRGFPRSARREVRELFAAVGAVLEVSESKFDVFTTAFSPSHGYHAAAALADAAQTLGLDRKTALAAAAHALGDAVISWRESDIPLDDLLEEAATPGGTAAAVMTSMDNAGYRTIVQKGLAAGIARAKGNAKLG